MSELRIAVLSGDGIGPEVMTPCVALLERVLEVADAPRLALEVHEAGAGLFQRTGVSLPDDTMAAVRGADAILLGAMGLPEVRYPDGTEVVPQIELRERLDLYAGVRPIRLLPGVPTPLSDPRARTLDAVLIRESTEGLFESRRSSRREGDAVVDSMRISRRGSERLFTFAFDLARSRKEGGHPGRVTCVDKANVIPSTAFFRSIFLECAARYPDIEADCIYVDAAGLKLVRAPWSFDVLVTENLFGDILSDVGAALIGGMGMAPSADIGDDHAVFQPCHGTAPDIAGSGLANPTAMFLSGAMMLDWLGERHGIEGYRLASAILTRAVEGAFAPGNLIPHENGGSAGTAEITSRVFEALESEGAR
jgi:3-isopropylmalate dehydrogenase